MQPLQSKKQLPFKMFFVLLAAVICITGFSQYLPAASVPTGEKEISCAECHDEVAAKFKNTAHAVIDAKGLAGQAGAAHSCAACHGDDTKHKEEENADSILTFKNAKEGNDAVKACLSCHKDTQARYMAGPHGIAGMDCTKCHTIHSGKMKEGLLKGGTVKTCYACHMEVFAEFNLNERHRLKEGIMTCVDCHDPHEPAARTQLAGFKQQTCFKCHTDKQGPYLFEHNSVAIEGCTVCHSPHGSPNRHMLKDQSVSQLCYSCHTTVPGWHSRFTPESNCANCHSTIHGSNFSSKFLK